MLIPPSATSLATLLARARQGEELARQQLILRHHGPLMGLIRAELNPKLRAVLDPEDVLQETYTALLARFDSFSGETPEQFRHWIYAVARNKVRELGRAYLQTERRGAEFVGRGMAEPFSQSSVRLVSAIETHMATVSADAVRIEALDALAAALAMLPEHYRQVIEIRYIRGASVEETAEKTGRTRGAVLMISHRAMRQMAHILRQFPLLTRT